MQTLAIAESLTVWHIQTLAGSQSWSSRFFLWWITAYTLEQKVTHLKVDRQLATQHNCVHPEIAIQMAQWVIQMFWSDWGIATTWYAEPWDQGWVVTPYARYAIVMQKDNVFHTIESAMLSVSWTRLHVQHSLAQSVRERLQVCGYFL